MSYTVKILSSENFDKLPFERAKTSLGAADAKKGVAYIRDTGYNDITKGTISHELDELMQGTSPHEVDGIRYKDMGSMFSGIGDFGKSAMGAVGSGVSALGRGVKNVFTPGPAAPTSGFSLKNLGLTGATPMSGSGAADQGFGNILGAGMPGFQKTGGAQMLPIGNKFGGVSAANAAPNVFDQLFKSSGAPTGSIGTDRMPSPTQPYPGFKFSQPTAPESGGAGNFIKNIFSGGGKEGGGVMDTFQKSLPGAAVSLLGGLMAPKTQTPDFSGIRDDLKGRIGAEGGSPAYDLGFGEAKRIIDDPFGTVPQEMFDPIDLRLKENITALENRFRDGQGGGALSESDTSQFGRLRAQLVDQAEKEKAQLEFQYKQQQQANKIVTMQELLRLDQSQFTQYAKLAELDVSELMMQTGVDVQTATEFKQLFSGIGESMIQGALNPQTATA